MRLLYIALLVLGMASLGTQGARAVETFTPGECVTINTYLEVIVGPDPSQPNHWFAQSLRYGRLGTKTSWDAGLIKHADCPDAAPTPASCPAAEPDSDGRTPLEVAIRGAIRTEEENAMSSATVIQFKQVSIGQTQAWTTADVDNYPQGNQAYGLVPAQADYVSCSHNDAYMYKTERNRYFICFAVAANGAIECDVVSTVTPDQIIETTPLKQD